MSWRAHTGRAAQRTGKHELSRVVPAMWSAKECAWNTVS